jgi:small-conductance mechanosensitive channel
MGATLTLTLTCSLFWLGGPEGASKSEAVGATESPPADKVPSVAERIARLQRMLDGDRKHLDELKQQQQEGPESEYARAEKAFGELDALKKEAEQALQRLRKAGETKVVAEKQKELDELQKKWQSAKVRFELAIQERRTRQEAILTLEKKIQQDERVLEWLKNPAEARRKRGLPPAEAPHDKPPATPPAPAAPAPAAPPAQPGPKAGPEVPGHPAAANPATAALPGLPGAPAKPEAAKPKEEEKPATKELVAAQKEARAKEEKARRAQAKARSLTERIETLRISIRQMEELRETARKKSDQAYADKEALDEELKKKVAAGAPDAELEELWRKIDRAQGRIREARQESRAQADRLRELNADLQSLQAEHIAALREAEQKGKEAEDARRKVAQLENPFHPINLLQWGIDHGPKLALIIAGMFFLRWLGGLCSGRVVRLLARSGATKRGSATDRANRANTLAGVFHNTATLFIFGGGCLMVLDEVGIPIVPLMGGAAVVGLAVAFGAQNLIKDYFSGFMVLVEDQYGVNDVVRIGSVCGLVEHISLRMTVIRDLEGVVHFVPHGTIQTVSNLTHGWSRALFDVGVAYKEDVDRVMKVLVEIGQELRHDPRFSAIILDNPEMLGVNEFADSSVVIRFFIKTVPLQQWPVKREMLRRIKKKFDEVGIEIPFPHRTVYHRCDDGPVVLAWEDREKLAA